MLHQPFQTDSAPPKRQAPAKRQRRLFGWREVLLVVVAFLLLALLPSSAQWAWSVPSKPSTKDLLADAAERADENFSGSAFFFLDPDMNAPAAPELKLAKSSASISPETSALIAKADLSEFETNAAAAPFPARCPLAHAH